MKPAYTTVFPVVEYDLDATLASGQVFRWRREADGWTGVVGGHWVRLVAGKNSICAETVVPVKDWNWLADFLQVRTDLAAVLATFPDDEPMRRAVSACRGLRLLRQDIWECLATFILSATKQIVQIQQIVALLCERFGDRIPAPGGASVFAFPTAARLAAASEAELRACKMGFRAPNLLTTARAVAAGQFSPSNLRVLPLAEARTQLLALPGVGRKIADCVLLFGGGFDAAFPIDVWVMRALQELYFPRRRVAPKRLQHFAANHFGPHAGCAQQYLFHYMRTKIK